MNSHKIRVFADIYLNSKDDEELITLYDELDRFNRNHLFIWLAHLSIQNDGLHHKYFFSSGKGKKVNTVKIIRLQILYMSHPELLEFWENLPRGAKSVTFVALIKSAIDQLDGKIPKEALVRRNVIPPTPKEDEEVSLKPMCNFSSDLFEEDTESGFNFTDEDEVFF